MFAIVTQEQVKAIMEKARQTQRVSIPTVLPKRLQWTIPLMDDVMDEVRKKLNAPRKKKPDFSKMIDEVKKEMAAGRSTRR